LGGASKQRSYKNDTLTLRKDVYAYKGGRCVKVKLALVLTVLIMLVGVNVYWVWERQAGGAFAGIALPFDEDGTFIVTPQFYYEQGEISSFGNFSFSEVERTRTTMSGYNAADFHLHTGEFIELMNSFSPILVDAVSVSTAGGLNWLSNPFRLQMRGRSMYFWGHNDIYAKMIGIRMTVYQSRGYGYLFFSVSHREGPNSWEIRDNLMFHSLYRITPSDLARFSEFAERLERVRWFVMGLGAARPPYGLFILAGGVLLFFNMMCLSGIIDNSGGALPTTAKKKPVRTKVKITTLVSRFFRRQDFLLYMGVVTIKFGFFLQPSPGKAEIMFTRAGDLIAMIVIAYFIVMIALAIFLIVYPIIRARIKKHH